MVRGKDLSLTQVGTINRMLIENRLSLTEIAKSVGVAKQTVSRLAVKLRTGESLTSKKINNSNRKRSSTKREDRRIASNLKTHRFSTRYKVGQELSAVDIKCQIAHFVVALESSVSSVVHRRKNLDCLSK